MINPAVEIYGDTFQDCSANLIIRGLAGSLAEDYADRNHIVFVALDTPDRKFVFPENLVEIGSEAFTEVNAWSVVIPKGVTTISGNPFAGSGVQIIFGYPGTAAETFADEYGYLFVSLESVEPRAGKTYKGKEAFFRGFLFCLA